MKMSLTQKREDLYHKIYTYKQRRNMLRAGCPEWTLGSSKYRKAVKRLNTKIGMWNRLIKNIDTKMNKIICLGNAVAYFTGFNVKNSSEQLPKGALSGALEGKALARCIFFKFGLENGMLAKDLREYVGMRNPEAPTKYRKILTAAINRYLYTRVTWNNFKAYYDSLEISSSDFIDNRKSTQ